MEDAQTTTVLADDIEASKLRNEEITTQLHFDLLKQYAWLSSAGAGATIVLVQLKVLELASNVYTAFVLFAVSMFFSVIGQDFLVDSLAKGKSIYRVSRRLKVYRYPSMLSLGTAVGSLIATFL